MNNKLKNFIGGTMIVGALGLPLAAKPLPLTADEPTQTQLTTEERIAQAKVRLRQLAEEYCVSRGCQDIEEDIQGLVDSYDAIYRLYNTTYDYTIEQCVEVSFYFFKKDHPYMEHRQIGTN